MHLEGSRGAGGRAALRTALVAAVAAAAAVGLAATASGATKPPANLSAADKALFQYAACMRSKGVNIPDPVKGKDGKYAFPKIPAKVLNAPGVRQKARECAAQLPNTRGGGQGSVSGPIVSVQGKTFTLKTSMTSTGKSTVTIGSATITDEEQAPRSSLKVGSCVAAMGTRNSKGVVTADRITISSPVKGQCGGGFFGGRGGGRPGGNGPPPGARGGYGRPPGGFGQGPPGGGFGPGRGGNSGFAFGSVTKVSGSTLTVKGSFGQTTTSTTVTVTPKTSLLQTVSAGPSAIKVKLCAFVLGTSSDKGVTVKATRISLTPETNGSCGR